MVRPCLRYRDSDDAEHECALDAASARVLVSGLPWRPFRWHHGQRHYSGTYWCATTAGYVVYESRLELARLILADFDPLTVGIAAQPFLIEAKVSDQVRRHVPDFLLQPWSGRTRTRRRCGGGGGRTSPASGYHAFALRLPSIAVPPRGPRPLVLDSHGCANEPLAWSPPPEWADTENLPLPDLDRLDMDRLALLLRGRRSPSAIADDLGTSLDHFRLVLRRNPGLALLSGPRRETSTSGRTVRTLPPANLTTERLRPLVLDDRRTLRSLAEEFGVNRTYLADRLRRDGIPVPPPYHRPTRPVDPDWLRTEYVDRKRTLPAIATEVGMTPVNLARISRTHSIPLRRRGGASHAASLTVNPGWPQPLADSVLGQSGTERVRRFQVYARHRSLTQAADALSVHQSVLTSQLGQLEIACGGQLIVRSARTQQSQSPTALGRLLLNQADKHLGPHPEAPPTLLEPLATALASF